MNITFRILSKELGAWSVLVFYGEARILFIKPIIMGYVNNKWLNWFPVYNNSCSSYISHQITLM